MVRVVPARLRVVPSAALLELSRQDADEADGAADTEHRAFRHALLAEGREGLAAPAARGVLLRHRRLTDRRRDGATARRPTDAVSGAVFGPALRPTAIGG